MLVGTAYAYSTPAALLSYYHIKNPKLAALRGVTSLIMTWRENAPGCLLHVYQIRSTYFVNDNDTEREK